MSTRLILLVALAFVLTACAHAPRATSAKARAVVAAVRLEGDARLSGNLVVYWMRPHEVRRDPNSPSGYWLRGFASINAVLERAVVLPRVELGGVRSQLAYLEAPPDALVFALFDVHGRTFDALLDDALQGDGVAIPTSATARANLVLQRVGPRPPKTERCSGPRDRLEIVDAPEVAGTIGNTTARRICVHLPRDYDDNPTRRYPVVYVLPGFSGVDSGGSVGGIFDTADQIALDRAAILVGVNLQTKMGASYLERSPLTGDWDHFLAVTVPSFVDRKYRTVATGTARALIGQSTGGFGAISFALQHADRFGVVAASAPDGLDLASWLLTPEQTHLQAWLRPWLRIEALVGPPGQFSSYAAAWSPDGASPFGVRWPADPKTGAIQPEVFAVWRAHSPSELLREPRIAANARTHLANNLCLAVGKQDEFGLFEPTRRFSQQLDAMGIAHTFVADEAGHQAPPARQRTLVEFVTSRLTPTAKSATVPH